jgi:hypothetical protein
LGILLKSTHNYNNNFTKIYGAIKLIKPIAVKANQMTTMTLDFDALESIKENGNHKYTFKPVIKVIQE